MISVNQNKCSGCAACVNICPVNAITMMETEKGFLFPNICKEKCINCSLCDKVCQCENKSEIMEPQKAYYAVNNDKKNLQKSQSGGLFSALATSVIKNGGVCYGASIGEDLIVREKRVDNLCDIELLQGSKYVQCEVGDAFKQVENDLKSGISVLYSGTSCMVSGLKQYLDKVGVDTKELITCDLICYGVPSPKLYLQNIRRIEENYNSKITKVIFRNKRKFGWHKCVETYNLSNGKEIDQKYYTELFYSNFALRDSCYDCSFLELEKKVADITMGDFWGIENINPKFKGNDTGCSLAIVRSSKGEQLILNSDLEIGEVDVASVLDSNKCYATKKPFLYKKFWKDYKKRGFNYALQHYTIYGGTRFKIKRKILKIFKIWK